MTLDDLPFNELITFQTRDRMTPVGMDAVRQRLREWDRYMIIPEWFDPRWNTNQRDPARTRSVYVKKDDATKVVPVIYRGKFVGRVEQFVRAIDKPKLPVTLKKELGVIASNHMLRGTTVNIDFTQRLNWDAGDFGDGGSCFWGEYRAAREMMKQANFGAVRLYPHNMDPSDYPTGCGIGRAWIGKDPQRQCDMVVFNGYMQERKWSNYSHTNDTTMLMSQLVAEFLGTSYKMVALRNYGDTGGTMYINSGRGVVLGNSADIRDITEVDFELENPDWVSCDSCGDVIRDTESHVNFRGEYYCSGCANSYLFYCDGCDRYYSNEDDNAEWTHEGTSYCIDCYNQYTSECAHPDCSVRMWSNTMWRADIGPVCHTHRYGAVRPW